MRILVGIPESGPRGGPAACEPPFIDELRRRRFEVEEEVYAYAEMQSGTTNEFFRQWNLPDDVPMLLRR